MASWKPCEFYWNSKDLAMDQGIGCCTLDSVSTLCQGDNQFCEKFDLMERSVIRELENRGDDIAGRKRNCVRRPSSEGTGALAVRKRKRLYPDPEGVEPSVIPQDSFQLSALSWDGGPYQHRG